MPVPLIFVGEKSLPPFARTALMPYSVHCCQALSDFEQLSEEEKLNSVVIADLDLLMADGVVDFTNSIQLLRKSAPESRLICLCSKAATHQVVEAIQLGAHNFLSKPIGHNALSAALDSAFPSRHRVSPAAASAGIDEGYGLQESTSLKSLVETDRPVFISGEVATGKSTLAKVIHERSNRCELPLVEFTCGKSSAAVSTQNLVGYARGSCVGAICDHRGSMEIAARGTLLLESIHKMEMRTQQDLCEVLKTGKFQPHGGTPKPLAARLIVTSNSSVDELLTEGTMLPELALHFIPNAVTLSPLRLRRRELPKLAEQVVAKVIGPKHIDLLTPELLIAIRDYQWPGNFTEMFSIIQRLSETRNSRHVAELVRRKTITRQWPNIASRNGPHLDGPAMSEITR